MKSAKECVTTHLPNGLAPKMDGAEAGDPYLDHWGKLVAAMSRRAWKFVSKPLA